jgi:putative nucleotidyltransferase with HDIG domain
MVTPMGLTGLLLPGGDFDWPAIEATDWWRELSACPQEPEFHAEGDVATHTRMVCDALEADDEFRDSPDETRRTLRLGALFHDCGKPAMTRIEDGRISSRGHARAGAHIARRRLWEREIDPVERERICALVRWHMRPGFVADDPEPERALLTIAEDIPNAWLAILARADTRGRIASGTRDALDRVDFFAELATEADVSDAPFPFASDHSRVEYFRTPGRDPRYLAHDDTIGELVLLSGLPGSGKSTHVAKHLGDHAEICLDTIRAELNVPPDGPQERVAAKAREATQARMRSGAPRIAVNATNLRADIRGRFLSLAQIHRYKIRIVSLDVSRSQLLRQNAGRERAVPLATILRYVDRWEPPTRRECHELERLERW